MLLSGGEALRGTTRLLPATASAKSSSRRAHPRTFSFSTRPPQAKEYLFYDQGISKPEMLDESFVFMGPFVGGAGGLPRDEYLKAVGGFDIRAAFPDLNPNFHHFRVDPLDPGRVWFTSQASGTDLGGFLGNAPTGKRFETPPQARFPSLDWATFGQGCCAGVR